MLVILGFLMIGVFMTLIMTKKLTPVVALVLVPTIFGLFAGAGLGLGDMVIDSVKSLAPTAALLMFAIIYFGTMIDVGLFDPIVRGILRVVGDDPAKVVVGTAVLAAVVSLDGDGSTTFIITVAAMLPVYRRLGLSPVILTAVAGVANGVMNIVPWGGPTARAASALKISPSEVFVPMIPSMLGGIATVLLLAWVLGRRERTRLGTDPFAEARRLVGAERVLVAEAAGTSSTTTTTTTTSTGTATTVLTPPSGTPAVGRTGSGTPATGDDSHDDGVGDALDPNRATLRPRLYWFNATLTLAMLGLLILDVLPIAVLFMIGCAIALVVNFRSVDEQAAELKAHAGSVVSVVSMVLAAAVLIGILDGTGMVDAMAQWMVSVIPASFGPFMGVVTALISMPLTFLMSNDAFYFGVLPVLAETAANYGISPAEMARASIVGQPVHMQSPLVPAILLLVALAKVDLGDHHRKALWMAGLASVAMLVVGVLVGAIPFLA
ncbi:citrate:proton symporter [Actinomycetospora corticicola]|uniref:CitMHS family citrate-Mg2+:H+ or citrate-Ca2+:H+ symporter n=1 Tax=Actinomycetospora corticicola TaxID=663602 RepID=A0A7Y9DTQ6_9PSEU|nr:CitMHS family citrate-Mg2+:H+ or citrate-Ca2+:H+ symporter [Actinomycetospora corticicola]